VLWGYPDLSGPGRTYCYYPRPRIM
jgi:hypothetical protein